MARKDDRVADRRGFLKLAGMGTLAGGVTLVAGNETAPAEAASDGKRQLYRETDHIRTYYDLARG